MENNTQKETATYQYLKGIWSARHFWIHLSCSDLRSRWRRSFFGIFWTIIQPLCMTLLISFVFSKIFHTNIAEYAPYILSGMITWEFITSSAMQGSLAFVQADAYIKQCYHPLAIYTLRTIVANTIILMLATIPLVIWASTVMPQNFGWPWLAALSIYPILALIAWPMATFLAYMATRFRDIPHALGLILQTMWFVSPIYFEAKVFQGSRLHGLVDYNPIYHLLEIIRAPLLHGNWPTSENYLFCFATIIILSIFASALGSQAEKKVIFYL